MTESQAIGQRFIAAGPVISMREMAAILRTELGSEGKKVPTRNLPDFVVRAAALFDPVLRGQVFELGKVRRLSSQKTETQLGWSGRPIRETLLDTAMTLEAIGALK